MKPVPKNDLPLQNQAKSWENRQSDLRQRLADLIGKLLAKHWLRMRAISKSSQSNAHPGAVSEQ
jgi:hypothetical protein